MSLEEFGHQTVDCPAARGDDLQHIAARALLIECPLDRFNLASETPNAGQQLLLVLDCVSRNPSFRDYTIPWYGILISGVQPQD